MSSNENKFAHSPNSSRLSPTWFGDNTSSSTHNDQQPDDDSNTTKIASNTNEIDYTNLPIREDKKRGFYIQHLTEYQVTSYKEASALVNLGLENRIMAPTLMNTTSSRSHTVLTMNITQIDRTRKSKKRSKLLLVDLAGSERIKRTISQDIRLREAQSINSSLAALGNVIAALAKNTSRHVPFRLVTLTHPRENLARVWPN